MPIDDMGDGKIRSDITMSRHTDTWWQACGWGRKALRKGLKKKRKEKHNFWSILSLTEMGRWKNT